MLTEDGLFSSIPSVLSFCAESFRLRGQRSATEFNLNEVEGLRASFAGVYPERSERDR